LRGDLVGPAAAGDRQGKSDKDAKGLGGHDRSGTPVQPRGGDVPGYLHQAVAVRDEGCSAVTSVGAVGGLEPGEVAVEYLSGQG
jgi:hypothetical protein